jgi:hypothetical protein
MELCQVLIKYREAFGDEDGFANILEVLEGGSQ